MLSTLSSGDPFNVEQAFKEFSLESDRLEMVYRGLEERFKSIQATLQDGYTRLSGKLAELDFMSRYLEAILNHMSQGIIFIDLQGVVTTYNAAAQAQLKIPEKELLFHRFMDHFDDAFLGFSLQETFAAQTSPPPTLLAWTDQGQTTELEVEATFVSMGLSPYSMAQRPMAVSGIQGLLVLLRDVTKIRRLQQLTARHDRLKEIGELAAHLAHEIRNPLGGIKGFATLLQQELSDRPDLQQMAAYIVEGTDGLNKCVADILQYGRPYQLHLETVDLIPFVHEIRQLMQADAAWNEAVDFSIRSTVPTLQILVDPQLFKSALLNLCVNAVQAMPQGGKLTIDLEQEASSVLLRISDTGCGISQENLQKLFSPFFTTKQTGNGLGLAEVHKVIQAHQGSIEADSQVGQGTVFTIKIPLKIGESACL